MADINNIRIQNSAPDGVMFDKPYTSPDQYRYDLREFEVNTAANHDIEVSYDRIVIKKFRPNVWILKSSTFSSLSELCKSSKNLAICLSGISKHADLFNLSYAHHSVVGASGATIGYIRGLGIFPYSDVITGWQLTEYGNYAQNRGELPFSAYVWDSLTLNDGTKVQVASETVALRGDWGAGYNGYGKVKDGTYKKVLPDYTTFPTPYTTNRLSIGLYTGNAISFDAWQCENRVNSLKMKITQRIGAEGSTKAAYCYSNFVSCKIRVSGLTSGDRLEYGTGVMSESSKSITADGEYTITYGEGYGFMLYGDTANTNPITIELIENPYLTEDGLVDISDNPITIRLLNKNGIDVSSQECWDIYCGDTTVYHRDRTVENCWEKYNMIFPTNLSVYRNTLGVDDNIEWISPLKFRVKNAPMTGITLSTPTTTTDADGKKVSYPSFSLKIEGTSVVGTVRRIFTNTNIDYGEEFEISKGLTVIPACTKTIYRNNASTPIGCTEAQITIAGGSSAGLLVEIIPEKTNYSIVSTAHWSNLLSDIRIPRIANITDEIMKTTKWWLNSLCSFLWDPVKEWYDRNSNMPLFQSGSIFKGATGLNDLVLRVPNSPYNFGEDNFNGSDLNSITFVQEGENAHFSSPQRLLRGAYNLRSISIAWYNNTPTYLCGANTIVDGMSCGISTYPERFINWYHYRSNVVSETMPCTLMQYAFSGASNLVSIPAFPYEESEEENTMTPARSGERIFADCSKLTTVGPILNAILLRPSMSKYMFSGCDALTSIKIKNLNHGDWSLDGVTRNGIFIGNLKSLDIDSVEYLFNNLMDLNTCNPNVHSDTADKSFKSWSSDYFSYSVDSLTWDYAFTLVNQVTCKKRYASESEAPFIVSSNANISNMSVSVEGLQEGDQIIYGIEGQTPIITWSSDGTKAVTNTTGNPAGFKLISTNTDSESRVTITIVNGLNYSNPSVSSANLYCPAAWEGEDGFNYTTMTGASGATLGTNYVTLNKRSTTGASSALAYISNAPSTTLNLKIAGLIEGDTLGIGSGDFSTIQNKITENGNYTINVSGTWGFKLWNDTNTSSTDTVRVTNAGSISKVSSQMITAANAKGWNVYIGGTLK